MSKKKFPVRVPRYAAGIRTQESRSGVTRCWWAARWRQVLEDMGLKGRLGRGRNYAMSGQVFEMTLEGNEVRARVQGTRVEPYAVKIVFRMPEEDAHRRILAAMRAEPILVARLLADDLPLELEELFKAEGYDLFPGGKLGPGKYDMTTSCSCPDYANPCKHSSAVLYVLGEEIARRPMTLLELRGFQAEELCDED